MSVHLANDFSSFELTVAEVRAGQILTTAQTQVIQNLLSTDASSYINIEDENLSDEKCALRRAYLRGRIDAYRSLITTSQQVATETYTNAKAESDLEAQQDKIPRNAYEAFKMLYPDAVAVPNLPPIVSAPMTLVVPNIPLAK